MLWHHLFYTHPEYGKLVYFTGQIGKICVSLFLFLSAYGLTIQFNKLSNLSFLNTLKFQVGRFIKFYANYWIVFIVVVPIGVFLLGRTLEEAYSMDNIAIPFLRDVLGVNYLKSYNATWWFNTLIICCYLIFPFLFISAKSKTFYVLTLALVFHLIPIQIDFFIVDLLKTYLLIFLTGVIYAQNHETISVFLNRIKPFTLVILLIVTIVGLSILRLKHLVPVFWGVRIDPFLTLTVILLSILALRHVFCFSVGMRYLGKHSMNIYMLHTFIYFYFYSEFIYSFKYPILIFAALLVSSLCISIVLEYLKKIILFDNVVKKAIKIIK